MRFLFISIVLCLSPVLIISQSNLKFVKPLSLGYSVYHVDGDINSFNEYYVPEGRVWKIEYIKVTGSNAVSKRVYLNFNLVIITNDTVSIIDSPLWLNSQELFAVESELDPSAPSGYYPFRWYANVLEFILIPD